MALHALFAILRFILQWQDNRERDRIVFAGGDDCAPVKSANLLRDGQSQSRAARVGSAGFIQPVKPFKDGGKLFWRDGLALIFAGNDHKTALVFGAKIDLRMG